MRRVISFIACSSDGFIAPESGDLSFLDAAALEGEDYGYAEFQSTVDTVFMGRKTYQKVMELGHPDPHPGLNLVVFSRSAAPNSWVEDARRTWCSESPADWVRRNRGLPGSGLYCDGGAQVLAQLMRESLLDEMIVTVVPNPLNGGLPLWDRPDRIQEFLLVHENAYPNGVIQKRFLRRETQPSSPSE